MIKKKALNEEETPDDLYDDLDDYIDDEDDLEDYLDDDDDDEDNKDTSIIDSLIVELKDSDDLIEEEEVQDETNSDFEKMSKELSANSLTKKEEKTGTILKKQIEKNLEDLKLIKKEENEARFKRELEKIKTEKEKEEYKTRFKKELKKDSINSPKSKEIGKAIELISVNLEDFPTVERMELGGSKIDEDITQSGINIIPPKLTSFKKGNLIALYTYKLKKLKESKEYQESLDSKESKKYSEFVKITTKINILNPLYKKLNEALIRSRENLLETVSLENKPIYAFIEKIGVDSISLVLFKNAGAALALNKNFSITSLMKLMKNKGLRLTKEIPINSLAYSNFNRMGKISKKGQSSISSLQSFLVLDTALYKKLKEIG